MGGLGLTVLNLFLLTNMLCSTSALPLISALITPHAIAQHITGETMLASCLLAMLSVSTYGIVTNWSPDQSAAANLGSGMQYTWVGNGYDWRYFALTLGSSLAALVLLTALRWAWVAATGRQGHMWGFTPKRLLEVRHPRGVLTHVSEGLVSHLEWVCLLMVDCGRLLMEA